MAEPLVEDGTTDWSLGQDAWHKPDKLQENQYAAGVNVLARGGSLGPRKGFHQRVMTFEAGFVTNQYYRQRSYQSIWTAGKFQAAIPYIIGADAYVITVISGMIFRTNIRTYYTQLLSKEIKLSQYVPRINWSYASGKVVLYDYPDYPIIIDQTEVRRADPAKKEIPISTIGAFNNSRLWIANAGTSFTASDAVGNLATPDAPLTFNEVLTPSSPFFGQVFSLPIDEAIYPITAMGFIQGYDSSTGIGPLFVSTKKKVYDYQAQLPRDQWAQTQFGDCYLANAGIAGPRCFTNVNSDVIFLSSEGQVHAFSTARNDTKQWGNVPISREVKNYLKVTDRELVQYGVLGYFDNMIFISANPYRVQALDTHSQQVVDYAHGGFVVIDVESMASLLAEGTPVWAGLWTGVNPMEIVTIENRCFIISKDGVAPNGFNALYELEQYATFDTVRQRKRRVRSIVYTKAYDFKRAFDHKKEHSVALHLQNIGGELNLDIDRKPSHANTFSRYASWDHYAPIQECNMPCDMLLNGIAPLNLREIIFGDALDKECNQQNQDAIDVFANVQYRLTITAETWELADLKLRASIVPFNEVQTARFCEGGLKPVKAPLQCIPDWDIPEEDPCPK